MDKNINPGAIKNPRTANPPNASPIYAAQFLEAS